MSGDEYKPQSVDAVLSRIETQVTILSHDVKEGNTVLFQKIKELEKRQTLTEQTIERSKGSIAAISLLASLIITVAGWFVSLLIKP